MCERSYQPLRLLRRWHVPTPTAALYLIGNLMALSMALAHTRGHERRAFCDL